MPHGAAVGSDPTREYVDYDSPDQKELLVNKMMPLYSNLSLPSSDSLEVEPFYL